MQLRPSGLADDVLAEILHGRNLARHWQAGIRVEIDNPHAPTHPESKPFEIDLPDGRAVLHSGRAGRVEVESHHALENTLIPQALALLLAQQYARGGVMLVHGAAFEIDGAGILALGARGSGKSVLTAAALSAGARVVSDDWLLVSRDAHGRFSARRQREFLMLRHGWAGEQLLSALRALDAETRCGRYKSTLAIADQPETVRRRFPLSIGLDHLWLLERPRTGRADACAFAATDQATALASIIAATTPLLYGRDFPVESRALLDTARSLIATLGAHRLATGLSLVNDPARTFSDLRTRSVNEGPD